MTPDAAFSDLIGRIYDCALDNSFWSEVLGEITELLNGMTGDISVVEPLTGTGRFAVSYNLPDDVRDLLWRHYPISPGRSMALTTPLLVPICTSRDLDIEAFHNSRYWQLSCAGRGYYDYLVTGLTRKVTELAAWGVFGSEERGAFQDSDLELARLLSPHIKRSLAISGVLDHQRIEVGSLRKALDEMAAAAIILEPDGAIRFCNAAAQAELTRGSIFKENKGRLLGMIPDAAAFLASLLKQSDDRRQRGRDVLLSAPSGRHLHVTWAILEQVGHELGSPILLVLQPPGPELQTPLSAAASRFGLTTAETQTLAEILDGRTLAEAATNLGVARSTVKSHVDALFRKTDTRRQAELVRVVLAGGAVAKSDANSD